MIKKIYLFLFWYTPQGKRILISPSLHIYSFLGSNVIMKQVLFLLKKKTISSDWEFSDSEFWITQDKVEFITKIDMVIENLE